MAARPTRIYAGAAHTVAGGVKMRGGLFRRGPGDGPWESVTAGLPERVDVRALAVHPTNHDILFAGTQDGPVRSTDGGMTWERLAFPDRNAAIWAITVHPTRPSIVYAGTAPVALYRSLDGGDSWHRLPGCVSPAHCEREGFDTRVIRIAVDPTRPDDVYVGLEVSGVLRSSDGGETFTDLSETLFELAEQPHLRSNVGGRHCAHCEGMLDTHAIALSAAAPGTPFLALRMGLFRSDNRGTVWYDTKIGRFSPITYCRDVIVSPHDPKVMYTCLSQAAFSTAGTLFRSADLGETWQRFDRGVQATSTMMAVFDHPDDPAQVWCVARGGQVFGTLDAGATWREHPLPEGVNDAYAVVCV